MIQSYIFIAEPILIFICPIYLEVESLSLEYYDITRSRVDLLKQNTCVYVKVFNKNAVAAF